MVKGVARRVIVVKSPDPKLFEQAIFIVKEDALVGDGVSADQVLAEAQQVADRYVRRNSGFGKHVKRFAGPLYAAVGAVIASVVWCLTRDFHCRRY